MSPPRPSFVCIGPKRSATTWLADQLKFHRDIWLTPIQELNYLSGGFADHAAKPYMHLRWSGWEVAKRVVRNKGPGVSADAAFLRTARRLAAEPERDLEGYRQLFAPAGSRVSGDISPMYASMGVAEIRDALPAIGAARIILLARDPVQRFWSELAMHARKRSFGDVDYTSVDFARAFFADPVRQRQHLLSDIAARWHEGFGRDRLEIIYFDDIVADAPATLRRIVELIGADWRKRLPGIAPTLNRKQRAARFVPQEAAAKAVREWFAPELDRCADAFGAHGKAWQQRQTPQ
ncbi:sulfotransferase [Novosphingobium aquimarinum]|uniref:sulfotransferase n=1 Tax=Novosphingobium aquimarinum TaxID=2682494 RepID=UPI0012EB801E|nr:sulfotransferase [Novosphingobium aquimarinum]